MFSDIGNKINSKFFWCVGGFGDAILLLSSFYDTCDIANVVFWANNRKSMNVFLKEFKKINKLLITDNYLNISKNKLYYKQIISDKKFCGKAHIPNDLNYLEWASISDPFSKYNISRSCKLIKEEFFTDKYSEKILVQPYSQCIEKYKKKEIKKEHILSIIENNEIDNIIFTGSENDIAKLKNDINIEFNSVVNIKDTLKIAASVKECHSCDSWIKNFCGVNNVKVYYYVSEKIGNYKQIFGVDFDPADKVFIKKWGFNIVNQFNYDISHIS